MWVKIVRHRDGTVKDAWFAATSYDAGLRVEFIEADSVEAAAQKSVNVSTKIESLREIAAKAEIRRRSDVCKERALQQGQLCAEVTCPSLYIEGFGAYSRGDNIPVNFWNAPAVLDARKKGAVRLVITQPRTARPQGFEPSEPIKKALEAPVRDAWVAAHVVEIDKLAKRLLVEKPHSAFEVVSPREMAADQMFDAVFKRYEKAHSRHCGDLAVLQDIGRFLASEQKAFESAVHP